MPTAGRTLIAHPRHTREAEGLHAAMPERRRGDYVFTFEISDPGLTRA